MSLPNLVFLHLIKLRLHNYYGVSIKDVRSKGVVQCGHFGDKEEVRSSNADVLHFCHFSRDFVWTSFMDGPINDDAIVATVVLRQRVLLA